MSGAVHVLLNVVVIVTGDDGTQSVTGPFRSPQAAGQWIAAQGWDDSVDAFVTRMDQP
jgi:hypothetical protein